MPLLPMYFLKKYPVIFRGETSLDASKKKKLDDALNFFNMFLADQDYAAGNHLTIADLSLIASASTMEVRMFIPSYNFNYLPHSSN
jgi:glutathione S-transferase